MTTRIVILATLAAAVAVALVLTWPRPPLSTRGGTGERLETDPGATNTSSPGAQPRRDDAESHLRQLVDAALTPDSRPNEAIVTFRNRDALESFLERARNRGLRVVATIDTLATARVQYDSISDLQDDLLDHPDDYDELGANTLMLLPLPPPIDERESAHLVPVGNRLLDILGVAGDSASWGRGVTIAIIDSGIASDPTFGTGRVSQLELGSVVSLGNGDLLGHGTAVAALAAGSASDARGIAPEAHLLSLPVLDQDGLSDTFTVAQAIIAAVDAGAQILNLSLGSSYNSPTLQRAIDYAIARDIVVVAAAGNNQSTQLSWPAADPRVVSVGAVDAMQQQVMFSNSGEQLQITAPGYGVQTAWSEGDRVLLDGTSASAPIVAGAVAAVMSQNPGMTAGEAWSIIRSHSADAGPPGPDSDYGYGVLDIGWAMAYNDNTRFDTAVASHFVEPGQSEVKIAVQNRSANPVSGLRLDVAVAGASLSYALPIVAAGGTEVIAVPLDLGDETDALVIPVSSRLVNPPGTRDAMPENNLRSTTVSLGDPDEG